MNAYVTIRRNYGCLSKRTYLTFAEAKKNAKFNRQDTGGKVAPYHCNFCGKYHVGSHHDNTKRGRRRYEPTIESELQELLDYLQLSS